MRLGAVAGLAVGLWHGVADAFAVAGEIIVNLVDFVGEVLIGIEDDDDDFDDLAPA